MKKDSSYTYYDSDERIADMMCQTLDKYIMEKIILPYKKSEKIIDMHAHTNYSDGDLSPQDLIRLAIDKRIGTLAITDHDTIEGIKKVDRNEDIIVDSGIEIINGIELSAKTDKGRMHILGYGIDLNNKSLNKKINNLNKFNKSILSSKSWKLTKPFRAFVNFFRKL